MISRRKFLQNSGGLGLIGLAPSVAISHGLMSEYPDHDLILQSVVPLSGQWNFQLDPGSKGLTEQWYASSSKAGKWEQVDVPHTWQIIPGHEDYFGEAWYKKEFYAPAEWENKMIRIEFEAVYHSAKVWLNGKPVGEHLRKGYTAFFIDLTEAIKVKDINTLTVWVNNDFDDKMLPRGKSYDWAADGGIIRPVSLHISEKTFIGRVAIHSEPDLNNHKAEILVSPFVTNKEKRSVSLEISYRIRKKESENMVVQYPKQPVILKPGESKEIQLNGTTIDHPSLWHFDHPHLYVLELALWKDGHLINTLRETFGIRKIEIRNAGFYLNGERVWLMGAERMAGSNPDYGMAEPAAWIEHDHRDLKNLNCTFTRVHWQQDKRVLDYCDEHGIFIQSEVPTWGAATFEGMTDHPSEEIMNNGLEQLQEMIHRDRNHPSIFSWGLCNEINGQNPPAAEFAGNMLKEAKKLDPDRLCSYASNSLQETPEKDVSRFMDFVEWNEYYESWYKGTVEDMEKNLEQIHQAFPDKPIVISEYGWCRCTPDRKVGDPKKIEILQSNDEVFRRHDYVAGLIFFDYNDYRTHMGDKGIGALKQRVHGVVDLYGAKKPSYDVLRFESGPILSFNGWLNNGELNITLVTRNSIPAYILQRYTLHWIVYADQNIPLEQGNILLPDLKPGDNFLFHKKLITPQPEKIIIKIKRPTGFSTISKVINNGTDDQYPINEY